MVFSRYIIPIGILILIIYICNSDHKEYFSNDSGIGQTGKNGYLGYTGQIGELPQIMLIGLKHISLFRNIPAYRLAP